MLTRHLLRDENTSARPSHGAFKRLTHRPSGRHGGPCAVPDLELVESSDWHGITTAGAHESYVVRRAYEKAISLTKRALSKHRLEILRECDLRPEPDSEDPRGEMRSRILYVTEPGLLATAMRAHPSAALWLPVPVAAIEAPPVTRLLVPVEAIVRDRAALLGLRERVQRLYASIGAALDTVGSPSPELTQSSGRH